MFNISGGSMSHRDVIIGRNHIKVEMASNGYCLLVNLKNNEIAKMECTMDNLYDSLGEIIEHYELYLQQAEKENDKKDSLDCKIKSAKSVSNNKGNDNKNMKQKVNETFVAM